jgi:hypothetical protein
LAGVTRAPVLAETVELPGSPRVGMELAGLIVVLSGPMWLPRDSVCSRAEGSIRAFLMAEESGCDFQVFL